MTATIKVTIELRDRLKDQATRRGLTLGAHLAALADIADREQRFSALRSRIASTSADQMDSYARETADWETTELRDRH